MRSPSYGEYVLDGASLRQQQGDAVSDLSMSFFNVLGTIAGSLVHDLLADNVPAKSANDSAAAGPDTSADVSGGGPAATAQANALPFPGEPNVDMAEAAAQQTLSSIDFSQRDIVLWVPATNSHQIPAGFADSIATAWGHAGQRPNLVDYPASVDFNDSVSTGMETLARVIDGIEARGEGHNIVLAGHSQGAWVIGEVMADERLRDRVDRAVMFGHPSMAGHHYANGGDDKVVEVNDQNDPFTHHLDGSQDLLEAVDTLGDTRPGSGGIADAFTSALTSLGRAARDNPFMAFYLGAKAVVGGHESFDDPHHYDDEYASVAQALHASTDGAQLA